MAREITEEWRKHASPFAIKWWRIMVTENKVVYIRLGDWVDLWMEIEACANRTGILGNEQLPGMEKDFHLIRAALQTDKAVISRDNKARNPYSVTCNRVERLRDILWMDASSDKVTEWIQGGALRATARYLYEPEK